MPKKLITDYKNWIHGSILVIQSYVYPVHVGHVRHEACGHAFKPDIILDTMANR